jgi:hypothetical protein
MEDEEWTIGEQSGFKSEYSDAYVDEEWNTDNSGSDDDGSDEDSSQSAGSDWDTKSDSLGLNQSTDDDYDKKDRSGSMRERSNHSTSVRGTPSSPHSTTSSKRLMKLQSSVVIAAEGAPLEERTSMNDLMFDDEFLETLDDEKDRQPLSESSLDVEQERNRKKAILQKLCGGFCVLLVIVLAVVLPVVLVGGGGEKDKKDVVPTLIPTTPSPVLPVTEQPTQSPTALPYQTRLSFLYNIVLPNNTTNGTLRNGTEYETILIQGMDQLVAAVANDFAANSSSSLSSPHYEIVWMSRRNRHLQWQLQRKLQVILLSLQLPTSIVAQSEASTYSLHKHTHKNVGLFVVSDTCLCFSSCFVLGNQPKTRNTNTQNLYATIACPINFFIPPTARCEQVTAAVILASNSPNTTELEELFASTVQESVANGELGDIVKLLNPTLGLQIYFVFALSPTPPPSPSNSSSLVPGNSTNTTTQSPSSMPTGRPTTSSAPTSSRRPSSTPSFSPQPSISLQPSSVPSVFVNNCSDPNNFEYDEGVKLTSSKGLTDTPAMALFNDNNNNNNTCVSNASVPYTNFPNVIDQCRCNGTISQVPATVATLHQLLRVNSNLLSLVYGNNTQLYPPGILSSCDPVNMAMVWLASGFNTKGMSGNFRQRYILAHLFLELNGTAWEQKNGWFTNTSECLWQGVTCNTRGIITQLSLSANQLRGSLPAELSKLEGLQSLVVNDSSQLSGPIPSALFSIPCLIELDLAGNRFTGSIPIFLDKNNNNNSSSSSTAVSKFQRLRLDGNQLSGTIPAALGNLVDLTQLTLHNNQLSGTVPSTLGRLVALEQATLYGNPRLVGVAPRELCALRAQSLETLVMDCPVAGKGVNCSVPSCCTSCVSVGDPS